MPPDAAAPGGRDDAAGRVLLVDDREDNLVALCAVLEPLNFELLTATSGADALRLLLDQQVSAIVLDVQMPDMDGFETAALLKTRAATRSIPILFLTAVGHSLEHELRGYEVGGVDYICKPFEPKVLLAKVRAIVEWSAQLRALSRSSNVYREAAAALDDALASTKPGCAGGPRWETAATHSSLLAARRVLDLELGATLDAPSAGRAAVRLALAGQLPELEDYVVLLVSELVTNAVLHTRSAARIRVDLGPRMMRVEVEDGGTRMPEPPLPGALDESGRGLQMVQRLTDRCGWTEVSGGKSVWFELDLPGGHPQP